MSKQSINQSIRNLVIGYNRKNSSKKIPKDISGLCLKFFYEYDVWGKCSTIMEINGKRNEITVKEDEERDHQPHNFACGTLDISQTYPFIRSYSWTLQVTYPLLHQYICKIGLIKSDYDESKEMNNQEEYYFMYSEAELYGRNNIREWIETGYGIDFQSQTQTVIKMEVDVKAGKIKYWVNDKDCGDAFVGGIDFKTKSFHIMVAVYDVGATIKLIKFEMN
eukprot:503573_1